ncbi:Plug domain-containing protein [Aquimarina agarivorans]|uniref:Plug domain-containing protein n=1 Tax=Aquimarina agarivorans TaxID=980584 RepID=UPI0002FBA64B|nr:Plug domain-containing protein [Aquimarina agarivorans]
MYNTGHFFDQISSFNPYIIKDVEIFRGGTSVEYGDRISGAVIINTDDDLTDRIKIGGGLNLTHADFNAKIPLSSKAGFLIAGRRSLTDINDNIVTRNFVKKVFQNTRADIEDSGAELDGEESIINFVDVNFKFLWKPNSQNTLTLNSIYTENNLNNFNGNQFNEQGSFFTRDNFENQSLGASVNWKKKYTPSVFQKISVYTSQYLLKYNLQAVRNQTEAFFYK